MRRLLALIILFTFLSNGQGRSIPAHIVVAQDGSGNFSRINNAIQATPNNSLERYIISIKKGIYTEKIIIDKMKTNIVLIGEGMENTIISGQKSDKDGQQTWNTSTVWVEGEGFMARGITFENIAGPQMFQAVALGTKAEYSVFFRCRFKGFQDTLYIKKGTQFFRECEILGTIDFIFGNSKVVFQNCAIIARKPLPGQFITITAQKRDGDKEETRIVFQNCTITATQDLLKEVENYKCYLGRPWRAFSRVVIIQSFLDYFIEPEGWTEWNGKSLGNPFYAEYENRGPGANTSARVNWSRVVTNPIEASYFTVRNFIKGDTWIPLVVPYYLDLL